MQESVQNLDRLRHANGDHTVADVRLKMQKAMQTHAAVFRDGHILKEGCEKVMSMTKDEMTNLKLFDRDLVWNTDLVEALELQNLMLNSAQVREVRKKFDARK